MWNKICIATKLVQYFIFIEKNYWKRKQKGYLLNQPQLQHSDLELYSVVCFFYYMTFSLVYEFLSCGKLAVSSLAVGSEVVGLNQSLCKKIDVRLPSIFPSLTPSPSGDRTGLALCKILGIDENPRWYLVSSFFLLMFNCIQPHAFSILGFMSGWYG